MSLSWNHIANNKLDDTLVVNSNLLMPLCPCLVVHHLSSLIIMTFVLMYTSSVYCAITFSQFCCIHFPVLFYSCSACLFEFLYFFLLGGWLQVQERREALKKVPEQIILTEVRKMVEEMQAMNKKLEETVSSDLGSLSLLLF